MLHVGEIISDDGTVGEYREIPYAKPAVEAGGVRFVWGRWPGTPFGVLEVFGPADQVPNFFAEKKAQILADDEVRYGDTVMG